MLRKLHFSAVMFVDTGRVDACDPEYLSWPELQSMQGSGRWQLQLHAGRHGHEYIQYGPTVDDTGPYYAYEEQHEGFDGWRERVRSDIEGGQKTLTDRIATYEPLAFAPPYGSYGQDGTNDPRIPDNLLGWLTQRYEAVFTQDAAGRAYPGAPQPLGRIQITRAVSGGDLHARLLAGK
jgi:Polysaccharide deacetylase